MRKIFGDLEGFIKFMGVEMDKKEVGKRIRQARIRLGLSRANLAKLVGVNERTITNYENGKTMKPSILQKIAKALEVDPQWLLTGEGSLPTPSKIALPHAFITLNFYPNVVASAGYGTINENEEKTPIHVDKAFLELLGIKPAKNLDIIRVVGDSMEPFIKNGEYVIIERTQVARNNEIVIAVVDGEVYVKRLQKDPVRRIIKLTSANPTHLDIELKEEELDRLRIIGVIRAKIRPL